MKDQMKDAKVDVIALSTKDVIATSGDTGANTGNTSGGGTQFGGNS